MKLGAHVSAAVELSLALERGAKIGAECIQIFVSPPRQWQQIKHPKEEIISFREKAKALNIGPNFIHGTYLINLGTENPEHLQKSKDWLKYAVEAADNLGVEGVIFHTGSHKGKGFETIRKQIIDSISYILSTVTGTSSVILNDSEGSLGSKSRDSSQARNDTPKVCHAPFLILEIAAGAGGVIGSFEELGKILKEVSDSRLHICLDTQHTFALGYNLTTKEGIDKTLSEFDKIIGLQNLSVIHCNDSKVVCGSMRDRHENIGEGFIGQSGFRNLLHHLALQEVPFILEVPGFSGQGPDKENIKLLKELRA